MSRSLLVMLLVISGCKHKAVVPAEPVISFSKQVEPIVVNNCAQVNCHDGSGELHALTNYNGIMHYVSPGAANHSALYTSVISRYMPPSTPLTDEQAKLIYIWIMQGATNN